MSMYLARLLEVLGAKRTRSEERQDKSALKRKLEEKAAKDALRKKEPAPIVQDQATKMKSDIEKIQAMDEPCLFLINANITHQVDDPATAKEEFQTFLTKDAVKDALNSAVKLSSTGGIHSWIVNAKQMENLKFEAFHSGLMHFPLGEDIEPLPEDLTAPDLFKNMSIELEGVETPSKIITELNSKWAPFAAELAKVKKEEPAAKEVPTKPAAKPKEKSQEEAIRTEKSKEKKPEEKNEKEEDGDFEVGDAPKINIGKFRSLKDPHIFILDPRKSAGGVGGIAEYQNFLGPDKPGTKTRASVVLPTKAIKFLVSRKLRSAPPENLPVLVYFLSGTDAKNLLIELKRERPHFILGKFDRSLFDEDEPFAGLTIDNKKVPDLLLDEMNRAWTEATSEVSGNPYPAVQANTAIPLDFFRLLTRKQRLVKIYIGGQPAGSGSENTIYVLTESRQEADAFITLMRKFKMPSLFYERMSDNSDIDAGFKTIDPEELTPANALILFAKDSFDPKALVEVGNKEPTDKTSAPTQLEMLHTFAKTELKNRTQKPGAFVKGKFTIGTHVAQFNANMTVCFLWGSLTQHVKLNPADVLKQLPFVKSVNTNYL